MKIVENNEENPQESNMDEESCDIFEHIEGLINEIESVKDEVDDYIKDLKSDIQDLENDLERVNRLIQNNDSTLENLSKDYRIHLPDCENNVDAEFENASYQKITLEMLLNDVIKLLSMGWVGIGTFAIFASNYVALLVRAYGYYL